MFKIFILWMDEIESEIRRDETTVNDVAEK